MFLVSIYNRMYEERDTWNIRMEKLEHMEGSGEFRTEWSVDSFMYVHIYIYTRIWRQLGQNVVRSIGNNFWESLSDWLFILLTLIQSLIVRYYRFKFLFCSVPFPPIFFFNLWKKILFRNWKLYRNNSKERSNVSKRVSVENE